MADIPTLEDSLSLPKNVRSYPTGSRQESLLDVILPDRPTAPQKPAPFPQLPDTRPVRCTNKKGCRSADVYYSVVLAQPAKGRTEYRAMVKASCGQCGKYIKFVPHYPRLINLLNKKLEEAKVNY